eukprot:1188251-Prorocentrum_minimum.AAC.1
MPSGRLAIVAPYNIHVIAACKALPDRQWDPQTKAWTIPSDTLSELVASFRNLRAVDVDLVQLPKLAQRALEAK